MSQTDNFDDTDSAEKKKKKFGKEVIPEIKHLCELIYRVN